MTPLDRACRRAILAGLGVVLISSLSLRGLISLSAAAGFLGLSLATWSVVAITLWRMRDGGEAPTLGIATYVTLLRGLLVSLVAGFILVSPEGPARWLPGLLYTAAALTDRYDGIIARRLDQVTAFGARLDVAMDGLGLLVAPLVAVAWRRLPSGYLLVGAAYYLFHGGIALRRTWGLPVYPERLRPNRATRFFAGIQMTLVATALFPVLGLRTTTIAATVLMLPTLVFFARDWLIVVGHIHPSPPSRPQVSPRPHLPGMVDGGDARAPDAVTSN